MADFEVGIPDAEKTIVFEAFYDSILTKILAAGNGLGLAILKEFVSLHNGSIKTVNNLPKGVVFIVELLPK